MTFPEICLDNRMKFMIMEMGRTWVQGMLFWVLSVKTCHRSNWPFLQLWLSQHHRRSDSWGETTGTFVEEEGRPLSGDKQPGGWPCSPSPLTHFSSLHYPQLDRHRVTCHVWIQIVSEIYNRWIACYFHPWKAEQSKVMGLWFPAQGGIPDGGFMWRSIRMWQKAGVFPGMKFSPSTKLPL